MQKNIKDLLDELYTIDPSLQEHEATLIRLVEKIIAAKPDTRFDRAFAEQLKTELLAQPLRVNDTRTSFFTWPKSVLAVAGSAFAVVLVVAVVVNQTNPGLHSVVTLEKGAFGSLAGAQTGSPAFGQGGGAPLGSREAMSSMPASPSPMNASDSAVGATGAGKMMIAAPYYGYTFVYKGDAISLTENEVPVYRRLKPMSGRTDLVGALSSVRFGGMNIGSFGGGLTSFDIADDSTDGYMINVNLREGIVSINQNWQTWYSPTEQHAPLAASDVPADEKLLAISESFLRDHGVDMSGYGAPSVEQNWRQYGQPMPLAETKMAEQQIYVPDSISVIYPTKINDQEVVDTGGTKTGLRVSIDIRKNKVSNVWPIQDTRYESSAYAAETDSARIIKLAEQGMNYGYYGDAKGRKEVTFGTPSRVLVQQYVYNEKLSVSTELFVPALSFPVLNPPNEYFYPKTIIVPLAKELLDTPMYGGGPIRTMEATIDKPMVK